MTRRWLAVAAAVCIFPGVVGGAAAARSLERPTSSQSAVEATDDLGRQITLPRAPRRIVSLAPSATEMLFAIGLDDELVGVADPADYPPEAVGKPKVGSFSGIDIERVVALQPELVLATAYQFPTVVERIESLGIPVFVLDPRTLDQVVAGIGMVGELAGAPEQAAALIAAMQARIGEVEAKVATAATRPATLYLLSSDMLTAGSGSFIHDLLQRAGARNVAAGIDRPYAQISTEFVVASDPELIIVGHAAFGVDAVGLISQPGLSGVRAVRDGRVVSFPEETLISRPGPRIVEGFELLARLIHPSVWQEPRP